ncbi:conserved exported hypothetical protein [Hyphomicrobiales bacterium]|jgi:hypothetical protein|nr:conserved exported hypothetical protein [Hyphomicrobiales bacterium]CAH1664536.1 conserved exported hypothetical protein [Hyphomicrobiales bacterium]
MKPWILTGIGALTWVAATGLPSPSQAVVYCKTVGVPKGCVARPVGVGAPGIGVRPGVGVGAPGVGVRPGVGVGAPGVGVRPRGAINRGGPVNRLGVR